MPNWCGTSITIFNENQKGLNELYSNIEKWTSADFLENGFGHNWLGNIVGFSGISKWEKREHDNIDFDVKCRGSLTDIELHDGYISISTETAWSPMLKMWVLLCDKYLPGSEITFIAEEPGNLLYCTNDPDFIGTYNIDLWEEDERLSDFECTDMCEEEYLIKSLKKLFNTDCNDIDKLLKMFYESEYTDKMYINKWESSELTDFE